MGPKVSGRVKMACLRLLAKLQFDPARRQLVSGLIDSYIEAPRWRKKNNLEKCYSNFALKKRRT